MRFSALAVSERLRLAVALGILRLAPNASMFERARAARWLRRIAGRRGYDVVFEPLFRSKFGEHAEDISLAWFWARIHDRTASLGYLLGGFHILYSALVDAIRAAGGRVIFGATVTRLYTIGSMLRVQGNTLTAAFDERFNQVIATVPLSVLGSLAPELGPSFLERYSPKPGLAARCVILSLDRPLTDAYWISMCERGAPFMVAVEHTNLISSERYGSRHLLYLGNYGANFPNVPVDTLIRDFTPWLQALNPTFSRSWIRDAWQFVASDAQPIITPGYRDRIAPHQTPVPGLYVLNLYQVYPHDRGQNYAVELAELLVAQITRDKPD
jgi:protoporphyrinogen oxidase